MSYAVFNNQSECNVERLFSTLPMYDFPELRAAHAAFAASVAARAGLAAPLRDAAPGPLAPLYAAPGFVWGQTCGLPLATTLAPLRLVVLATPVHDAPHCEGPYHRSVLVVRAASPIGTLAAARGARCAVNGRDSNTGMNLLRAAVAPLAGGRPFFGAVVETGAHEASAGLVADSGADIAAIDAVTFALLGDLRPGLAARLRVLGTTPRAPALPYVAARELGARAVESLRLALRATLADRALRETLAPLRLRDAVPLPAGAYDTVLAHARAARSAGYPELA